MRVLTGTGGWGRALAPPALLLACMAAAGCAKIPLIGGKPAVRLKMTASSNLNDCGRNAGYPLTFRVIQVTDPSILTGMTLVQLWGREKAVLGPAFVTMSGDEVIDPGQTREVAVELDEKAKAVVVVGNFCRTHASCWYYTRAVKGGGISLRLSADAECLSAAR